MPITRRLYERFEIGSSVLLDLPRYKNKRFLLCNLSARGAAVYGYDPVRANEDVRVSFCPNFIIDKPISKYARVVWVNRVAIDRWEAGLDFGLDNLLCWPSQDAVVYSP